MALPVTITGLSTAIATAGPYRALNQPLQQLKTNGVITWGSGGNSNHYAAQVINVTDTFQLTSLDLKIYKVGAPTATISITIVSGSDPRSGTPIGTVGTILAANMLTAAGKVHSLTCAPITLVPGKYCIKFSGIAQGNSSNYYYIERYLSDVYAGGNSVTGDNLNYSIDANADFYFNVNGDGAASSQSKYDGDKYYIIGRDAATASMLRAFKATDPTASWAAVAATVSVSNSIGNISAYQDGGTIHVLMHDLSGTVRYTWFNTSTETFGSTENVSAQGMVTNGTTGSYQFGASLIVRASGEVVAIYNGTQTKTSGTNYARVYYSRRTSINTWSAAVQVDASTAFDNLLPEAVLGISDAVHFLWKSGSISNQINQRTLSAANALGTASATNTVFVNGQDGIQGVSYMRAAVRKVVFGRTSSSTQLAVGIFDSNAPAGIQANYSPAPIGATACIPRFFVNGTDVWVLYLGANQDLYVQKSINDGLAFSGEVIAFTGSVTGFDPTLLSIDGQIYQRGAALVIPYVVNDSGTLKYNEYDVTPPTADAWSKDDKASITLSNADKTATSSSTSSGVRSTKAYTFAAGGKYYAEFSCDSDTSAVAVAFKHATSVITNSAHNAFSVTAPTGSVYVNGAMVANIGTCVAGDVIRMAIDNAARLAWVCKNNGPWNGGTTGDPNTGIDGIDIAALPAGLYHLWMGSGQSGKVVTVRTELADLTLQGPIGFTSWMGETILQPSTVDAWDINDNVGMTLALFDKRAQSPPGPSGIRSTTKHSASVDKFYAEFYFDPNNPWSYSACFGIKGVTSSLTTNAVESVYVAANSGNIYLNTFGPYGNVGTNWPPQSTISIAWDTGTKLAWFRLNAGLWNGSSTADPATGVGGVDISTLGSIDFALWFYSNTSNIYVNLHTEKDEFTQTTPGGYLSWIGEELTPPGWPVTSLVSPAPVFSVPAFAQIHPLTPLPINLTVPIYTSAPIKQLHELAAPIATVGGSPVFGFILFKQIIAFTTPPLIVAPYVLGTPAVGQAHKITAQPFAPLWSYTSPAIAQEHAITPASLSVAPVLGGPAFKLVVPMFADNLVTSPPELAVADVVVRLALAASGFAISGFGYGPAVIHEINLLSAANLATGPPVLPATPWGVQRTFTAVPVPAPGRANLIPWSQEINEDNGWFYWVDEHITPSMNAAIAPDGTMTAERIVEGAQVNYHMFSPMVQTQGRFTLSIHAKAGTRDWICLWNEESDARANFNIRTGTVGFTNGTPNAVITSAANGYFRVSISVDPGSGYRWDFMMLDADRPDPQYSGDGVSYIDCWGAQLEPGPVATAYIPTEETAVTLGTALPVFGAPALTQRHPCVAVGYVNAAPSIGASSLGQIYKFTATSLVIPPLSTAGPVLYDAVAEGATVHIDFVHGPTAYVRGVGNVNVNTLIGNDPAYTSSATGYLPDAITPYGYDYQASPSGLANWILPAFIGALRSQYLSGTKSLIVKLQQSARAEVDEFHLTAGNADWTRNIWYQSDWTYVGFGSYWTMDQIEDAWFNEPGVPGLINCFGNTFVPSNRFEVAANTRGSMSRPLTNGDTPPANPLSIAYIEAGPIASITLFDTLSLAELQAKTIPYLYGAPAPMPLPTGSLRQVHALPAPLSIVVPPVIGVGPMGQKGVLQFLNLIVASPVIDAPAFAQLHKLAAPAQPVASPSIGAGLYRKNILPASFTAPVPTIGAPDLTLTIDALGFTVVPELGAPDLTKVLKPNNLTASAPAFTSIPLRQVHALATGSIVVTPDIPTAYLSQAGVFSLVPIIIGDLTIGTAAFKQLHTLAAVAYETPAPVIGATEYGRVINATPLVVASPAFTGSPLRKLLTPAGLVAPAPVVNATPPAITIALAAVDLVVTPAIDVVAITQRHVFVGSSITVLSHLVSPVVIGQAGVLQFMPLVAGQPGFTIPSLKQGHTLAATAAAVELPTIDPSAIGQAHALDPADVVAGAPALGTRSITQKHALAAALVPVAPAIGEPVLRQANALGVAPSLVVAPYTIGAPAIAAIDNITPLGRTTAAPAIDVPLFSQQHLFGTAAIEVGSPELTAPTFGGRSTFAAAGAAVGSPVFSRPAMALDQHCVATSLAVGAPVLGSRAIGVRVNATTPDIVVVSPFVGLSDLGQQHALTTWRIMPIPQLGEPELGQVHGLAAVGLAVAPPVWRSAVFGQSGVMAAVGFETAPPALGEAAIGQRHQLDPPIGVEVEPPDLGVGAYFVRVKLPRAQSAYAGRFRGPSPLLGQAHGLTALAASAGAPRAYPAGAVFKTWSDLVAPMPAEAGAPALGAPLMEVSSHLVPRGMRFGYPTLGRPELGQAHALSAADLAVAGPTLGPSAVGAPPAELDPLGFETAPPELGTPHLGQRPRLYAIANITGRRDSQVTITGRRGDHVTVTGTRHRNVV